MKPLACFVIAGLSTVATAQTGFLQCTPGAPSQVSYWAWPNPQPSHQTFFNLQVNATITLQAITTPLVTALGQVGTLEVWMTNPGITTYVGNTTIAANWSKAAEGQIIGLGTTGSIASLSALSCQEANGAGLVLAPGSYGVAIRYTNCNPIQVATTAQQTFTSTELTVSGGEMQATAWGGAVPAIGLFNGVNYPFYQWRGRLDYAIGAQPHACAQSSSYGAGCITTTGSFWQEWTGAAPAPAAAAALNGRTLTLTPFGSGYLLTPGTATWIPPSGTATSIAPVLDGETAIALTNPFAYPGGAAATLWVHENGYVSVASQNALPGGLNWVPVPSVMLSAPETAWWLWHDFETTEPGSGQIKWEEVGTMVVVTWDGVESNPPTAVNKSTFQFQFDTATGEVHYVVQTWDGAGGSGIFEGDDTLVGYSPGGLSPTVGPINVTTLQGIDLSLPERFPLKLTLTGKPLLGTTISLDTSDAVAVDVGLNLLSIAEQPAPGLDLSVFGIDGCTSWIDINGMVGNVISNIPGFSMSIVWPLPSTPSVAGVVIYSQSIMQDPGVNPFGAVVSNALKLEFGLY